MPSDPRREARPISGFESDFAAIVSSEDLERAKLAAQRDGSALLNAMLHAKTEAVP